MSDSKIVVFSIIRNGVLNGYPFVESYSSWLPYVDEIHICDGLSDDGTWQVLQELASLSPKFKLSQAPWPKSSKGGSAIATFTDLALGPILQENCRWLYVQADEFFEPQLRQKLSSYQGDRVVELSRYVLFWNGFNRVLGEAQPGDFKKLGSQPCKLRNSPKESLVNSVDWSSYRMFPPGVRASSQGDGLSFDIHGANFESWQEQVYHYGWCFPVNILQKHMSHFSLYPDNDHYKRRAKIAEEMIASNDFDTRRMDLMDPQYLDCAFPFSGEHLSCVQHLLAQRVYDPYVGIELLRSGARW